MSGMFRQRPLAGAGVSRRAFLSTTALRGLGVSIALPVLESFGSPVPVGAGDRPTRMAFVYVPNGVNVERWRPLGTDRDYTLGPTLEPLAGYRDQFQLISGLAHRNGTAGPDGAGDHARATATILTGARPRKTSGADLRVGISVDQVAAHAIGRETRFPSLELSCDAARKSGGCDSGYSCAYSFNMSWRSESQPATPEVNPRLVFERLFGAGQGADRGRSLAFRRATRQSILDFVAEEARGVRRHLGTADRRKLDEYTTGIREIERQLQKFDDVPLASVPDLDLPEGPPPSYGEHMRLMADMLVLAFQTDSTRIATLMFAHDGSNRTFPEIGVGDGLTRRRVWALFRQWPQCPPATAWLRDTSAGADSSSGASRAKRRSHTFAHPGHRNPSPVDSSCQPHRRWSAGIAGGVRVHGGSRDRSHLRRGGARPAW